ncbi:MAG: cupredoxin domain-containing protein [Patescibacteria group bacterium]|nr:cupredoxin domain-containing protein [Patescibacteria group bacterium]MDE2588265.1 cupredoxin domain-containing protein [Patescibacteria group bacterium]
MQNLRGLIVAGILILIIVAGGIYFYGKSAQKDASNTQPAPTEQTQTLGDNGAQIITLTADGFSPSTLTVKVGTRVRWVNKSGQLGDVDSDPHPTHTSYPPMNFGTFSDGSSVELVFNKAGTYHYHNHLNPSQQGTIVVE